MVDILLGDQWQAVIPILPVLAIAGIIQGTSLICNTLLLAKKKYFWMNIHLFLTIVTMIPLIALGSINYGLLGASWGLVISRALSFPTLMVGTIRELKQ